MAQVHNPSDQLLADRVRDLAGAVALHRINIIPHGTLVLLHGGLGGADVNSADQISEMRGVLQHQSVELLGFGVRHSDGELASRCQSLKGLQDAPQPLGPACCAVGYHRERVVAAADDLLKAQPVVLGREERVMRRADAVDPAECMVRC